MGTLFRWLILPAAMVLYLGLLASADESGVIQSLGQAKINWTTQYIEVSGEGLIPSPSEETDRSKAILKAKTYAKMSAVASIYAALDSLVVTNSAAGEKVLSDFNVRNKVDGFVRNVETVAEKKLNIGGEEYVVVTLRAPLYGSSGILSAMLEYAMEQKDVDSGVKLEVNRVDDQPSVQLSAMAPFTSLIVNCTDLKLDKAIWFRLRRPDLTDVFPVTKIKYEKSKMKHTGPAVYASSEGEATRERRAGNNPLVIRGRQAAGANEMCDIVISNQDADFIVNENNTSKFIEKGNLIIIVKD